MALPSFWIRAIQKPERGESQGEPRFHAVRNRVQFLIGERDACRPQQSTTPPVLRKSPPRLDSNAKRMSRPIGPEWEGKQPSGSIARRQPIGNCETAAMRPGYTRNRRLWTARSANPTAGFGETSPFHRPSRAPAGALHKYG